MASQWLRQVGGPRTGPYNTQHLLTFLETLYRALIPDDEGVHFQMIYQISRAGDCFETILGGGVSAEVQDDGCDLMTVSGIDIVLNHKLQETSYDKKFYMVYIKDYMKAVKAKLQETCPERVEPFVAIAPAEVKKTIGNIKNFQYFTGDSMNLDGSIGLLDFCEDGLTPYMLFFKDSLELGKC
ncbi:translationally-controlled tumor protein homolog [Tachysurus fulvidraco]|uniref:translationally-controlled tumor protein homolog n=1 Tax=Tachysurus fulvidraco TaxID=1234273 RepID=UPI001FED9A1F|nr:translationally-controlled tumor protein homolog [Tachysurus fulvidraco]